MSDEAPGAPVETPWTEPLQIEVRHLTRFEYHDSVWDSFNEARLNPVTDTCQLCRKFFLHIDPSADVRDYPDFYANCVHYFDIKKPHDRLSVEAVSLIETHPDTRGDVPHFNAPTGLHDTTIQENYFDFLHDSTFVSLDAAIWREGVDALPSGVSDLWLDTLAVGRHIYTTFKYTPSFTTVNTHPAEVVAQRKGVCQDFAHVMLGICRTQGIPARYVSGYFYNPHRLPDDIEASHAWVEVFLPGYGWKGFDPTHNRVPDTRYVKLAVGRDYADIRPLSGTFRGRGTREMIVDVRIRRVDEARVA